MRSISSENRRVALLREFERSGVSMAEFCRRQEVGYSTMAAWRRACRRRAAAFVEVEPVTDRGEPMTGGSSGSLCAELMLPGGTVLRVYQINPTGGQA